MIVSTKHTTSKDAACCVRKKTKQIKIKRAVLSRDGSVLRP